MLDYCIIIHRMTSNRQYPIGIEKPEVLKGGSVHVGQDTAITGNWILSCTAKASYINCCLSQVVIKINVQILITKKLMKKATMFTWRESIHRELQVHGAILPHYTLAPLETESDVAMHLYSLLSLVLTFLLE